MAPLLLPLPLSMMGPPQLLPPLSKGAPLLLPLAPPGTRGGGGGEGGGAQMPLLQQGGWPPPHREPRGVQGGGIASIMPASQQRGSFWPQLSTHGPPHVPFGRQQMFDLGSHTCPGPTQPPHAIMPWQSSEISTLQRPEHVAGTQHV
jgi:hypothetical protein